MYSPKISEDLIAELYIMGKVNKKPMTIIVDELLRFALQITKLLEQINNGGHDEPQQSNVAGGNYVPERKVISHQKSVG